MSYILDAIRKADQQRRRGEVPTLPGEAAATARRPALLAYGLLGLALLLFGIGIGWLSPWRSAPPPPAAASLRPAEPSPPRPAQAPPRAAPPASEAVKEEPPSVGAPVPVAITPTAVAPDRPVGEAPAEGTQRPGARSELPLSIQQELPPLAVAMHVYSIQPRDRLVSIDNRLLREGDQLGADLKLEEILPDGMIFSYRGYRFRSAAK